jgi:hypothetical protein
VAKRISIKSSDVTRPPEGEPFIWHQASLLRSPAWQERSINCRRLIDFLLIEQMAHGGLKNGDLHAPYAQLVQFGIGRRLIPSAIEEAEHLGLVRIKRGARKGSQYNETSCFRLTFYATRQLMSGSWVWQSPTDEWKLYKSTGRGPIVANRFTFVNSDGSPS